MVIHNNYSNIYHVPRTIVQETSIRSQTSHLKPNLEDFEDLFINNDEVIGNLYLKSAKQSVVRLKTRRKSYRKVRRNGFRSLLRKAKTSFKAKQYKHTTSHFLKAIRYIRQSKSPHIKFKFTKSLSILKRAIQKEINTSHETGSSSKHINELKCSLVRIDKVQKSIK